jgi:ThiF family protein/E1 ligase-like protein
MSALHLNANAHRENIRALMVAAGLPEEVATERLNATIVISIPLENAAAKALMGELVPLLSRTLLVETEPSTICTPIAVEVVIGAAAPRTSALPIFVSLTANGVEIGRQPLAAAACESVHPLKCLLAACYVTGAAIRAAVGDGMPNPPSDPLCIEFGDLVPTDIDLDAIHDIDEAYLAGAGAIGNGFLWAARHVSLAGVLHVVDDDVASDGNLQRQIWFDDGDVGKPKAVRVAAKAQALMPLLELRPKVCRLQDHPNRTDGPWLRRLIVAVDSRPARRHLQNELPGEVFDASTSGSEEIVLHYNRQPNADACLGCVYPRDEREINHEEAVAWHLGVDVSMVRAERINEAAAALICARHPHLMPADLKGLAVDSLYKQLCAAGQLTTASGGQVVAPFAFVSVLAGAMLLLEVLRRARGRPEPTNEWRLNPWAPPVSGLRHRRPRRANCECCGRPAIQRVNGVFWGMAALT